MILTYNLSKCLILYRQGKLENDILHPDSDSHIDTWNKFAMELMRIRGTSPTRINFSYIDRTGAVPSFINTYIPHDRLIPAGPPQYSDYIDICKSRARELLATGKQINVMWSGGLDSTVALFALIDQASNLDQINVLCTFESILEAGSLFDQYLKNSKIRLKFEQTRFECNLPYSYDQEDPTQLYVNGQCGDQLFGPKTSLSVPGVSLTDPWYNAYKKDFMDLIAPSVKFSARPIETVRDLKWWLFFNHTWTTVIHDSMLDRPTDVNRRTHAFYATPEFQRWAITTPTYYEDTEQYRWPAKQALSQLINCDYYVKNKTKSLSSTWKHRQDWYAMDSEFKTLYEN